MSQSMKEKESKPRSLRSAIGARLKILRGNERAEVIAAIARSRWGLPWTRSVVTQIENGRRRLWLEEWLLLPAVYTEALNRKHDPLGWQDFIGEDEGEIALTQGLNVKLENLQRLVQQAGELREDQVVTLARPHQEVTRRLNAAEKRARRWWKELIPMDVIQAVFASASDEACVRAARTLNVDPFDVGFASFRLWDRPFRAERDERLARAAKPNATAGRLRTLRGHVTRDLLDTLRTFMDGK
jgi:hypothetical protein